jgi:cell division septum initiation protein DivIVA
VTADGTADAAATAPVVALLDQLTTLVREARAMPMSASCLVHRDEVLGLLADLRRQLPEQLGRADALLGDREAVVEQGRVEAARLVEQAKEQQRALVAQTAVHQAATAEAQALLAEAREESEAMRLEVEDYVDAKLANFEVVIAKTLDAVQKGRARLHGESELDRLDEADDSRPLPG